MARKVLLIRYRRSGFFRRALYSIKAKKKAKGKLKANGNSQSETIAVSATLSTNKSTDLSAALSTNKSTDLSAALSSDLSAALLVKAPALSVADTHQEELATIDPENDPYAYLVSQLPQMLSAIPNLLVPDDNETSVALEQENVFDDGNEDPIARHFENFMSLVGHGDENNSTDNHFVNSHSVKNSVNNSYVKNSADNPGLGYLGYAPLFLDAATNLILTEKPEETAFTVTAKPGIAVEIITGPEALSANEKVNEEVKEDVNEGISEELKQALNEQVVAAEFKQKITAEVKSPLTSSGQSLLDWNRVKVGSAPLSELSTLKDVTRRFPWPGLPEESCQQIRFGGTKQQNVSRSDVSNSITAFSYQQLALIAKEQEYSANWLLLLLSPVREIRRLLANSSLAELTEIYRLMPSTKVNKLTVFDFLQQAIDSGKLVAGVNYLDCCINPLWPHQQVTLSLSQLAQYFIDHAKGHQFYKLTMASQVSYLEVRGKEVQLYLYDNKPQVFLLEQLASRLQQLTQAKKSDKLFDAQLTLQKYDISDGSCKEMNQSISVLKTQLFNNQQNWSPQWQKNFNEFVS